MERNTKRAPDSFQLVFSWHRSILDTEQGTFRKDMILDDPITIDLELSEDEMDEIWRSLHQNTFFSLPKRIKHLGGSSVDPSTTYTLTVTYDGINTKTVKMRATHHTFSRHDDSEI